MKNGALTFATGHELPSLVNGSAVQLDEIGARASISETAPLSVRASDPNPVARRESTAVAARRPGATCGL
jgi:hypothetical protein